MTFGWETLEVMSTPRNTRLCRLHLQSSGPSGTVLSAHFSLEPETEVFISYCTDETVIVQHTMILISMC
jgi:hypothetical protein